MNRADFKGMKNYFSTINWDSILDTSLSVNEWWEIIFTHLNEAKNKFVPKIKHNNNDKTSTSTRHLPVPESFQSKLKLKRAAFKTF